MKTKKYWILALGLLVVLIISVVIKKYDEESKQSQTSGTAAAINAALTSVATEANSNLTQVLGLATKQWQFLAVQEYDEAIRELDDKGYNLDASASRPLLDFWGNRLVIGFHKLPAGFYDFIVVSKGPDKIYGTGDDIVSPYGDLPPTLMSGKSTINNN